MAAGDPILVVGNLAAAATVDITLSVRAKIVECGIFSFKAGNAYVSTDGGTTFYKVLRANAPGFGVIELTDTAATGSVKGGSLYVPAGTVIRIENSDTVARDYLFNAVEY